MLVIPERVLKKPRHSFFCLPLLLFKFKFTSFIKNMSNMVENVKRNNELVLKLKLPSSFKQVHLKIYNGLNKQKLLKTLE